MKVVFIVGSAAVGKMTVGQALMERTGLRLFHNHRYSNPVDRIRVSTVDLDGAVYLAHCLGAVVK